MELPAERHQDLRLESIAPADRRDAHVRRQISGPAIRTFFKYKADRVSTLPYDMLMRISLVLGIYKCLHVLYPEPDLADRWVKLPNSNPLFGGKPALVLMTEGGMDGLYHVRRLLDGRRGGWN